MYQMEDIKDMLIYVADDDEINLKLVKTLLNQAGFENLSLYQSGKAMMDDVKHNCPDLLLLDIMMPGFSGYEVLEWIKQNPELENIPIIMITAAAMDEKMEPLRKSFELGAMDFISKPFSNLGVGAPGEICPAHRKNAPEAGSRCRNDLISGKAAAHLLLLQKSPGR